MPKHCASGTKHCASGTSTISTCKNTHSSIPRASPRPSTPNAVQVVHARGQDRYVARAAHAKILCKCTKHCASGTSTVRTCKHKHSYILRTPPRLSMPYTVQRTHTRTHDEWYNARAAHADRRTHTHAHTSYTARTVQAENRTARTHAKNVAHKLQCKFWPYTPPRREYAAHAQAPYGYCTVHMRTALARTNEHVRPFIRTWLPQPTRSSKPNRQSW